MTLYKQALMQPNFQAYASPMLLLPGVEHFGVAINGITSVPGYTNLLPLSS
jgi:hypothetical protein